MKKYFLIPVLLLFFTSTGWGLTITDTNAPAELSGAEVGDADDFIDWGYKLGDPDAEEVWVNTVLTKLGLDNVTFQVKQEEDIPYYSVNQANTYAFEIDPPDPVSQYFLIKNSTYVALFENNMEYGFGVFNLSDLSGEVLSSLNLPGGEDEWTVSHVTRFGTAPVPEPATLLLLGTGLVGLAGASRKKFKK